MKHPSRRRGAPRFTVRSRILAAILVVAGLGLGLAGGVSYLIQHDRVLTEIDDRLLQEVESARRAIDAEAVPIGDADESPIEATPVETVRQALRVILAVVVPPPSGTALGILDGRAAYVPGVGESFRLEQIPGFVARMEAETVDGTVRIGTHLGERTLRYVAVPVVVEGDDAEGIFVVAIDVDQTLEPLQRTFLVYGVVALVTLLAIGLVGWAVAGGLLRPIRTLRETAERITARDSTERIAVEGRDDVSRLTSTVNAMLDRLHAGLVNQRELLDDVRHELKTPLTILRGHLELVDPRDPDDVAQARALALDELDRMAALVDDLAALAEVRMAVVDREPVDLGDLTRDVSALASVIPGHRWVVTDTADGAVWLDRRRVVQAWLQLADNAAKYSAADSTIELGSRRTDGSAEMWVRDYGPGIPAADAARIFERTFRRGAGPQSGSGLGLAIVSGIARAHGGEVRLDRLADGTRFTIVLPTDPGSRIPTDNEEVSA